MARTGRSRLEWPSHRQPGDVMNGGFAFPDFPLTSQNMFSRIPFQRVNWLISSFLIGTLFLALTAVPVYIWFFGIDRFQVILFFAMFLACGFSITLGYHRLFAHLSFQAHWIVRLLTLIFGAGAFENSVLLWAC